METPSHRRPELPAATAEGLRSQVSVALAMKQCQSPPASHQTQTQPLRDDSLPPQVEHYFSDENLAKDQFLRSKMDQSGAVPMSVISGFARYLFPSTPACMDPPSPSAPFSPVVYLMAKSGLLGRLDATCLTYSSPPGSRPCGRSRYRKTNGRQCLNRPWPPRYPFSASQLPLPLPFPHPLPLPLFSIQDPYHPPGMPPQKAVKASSGKLSRLDGGSLPDLRLAGNKRKGGPGGGAASSEILINMPERDPDRHVSQSPPPHVNAPHTFLHDARRSSV